MSKMPSTPADWEARYQSRETPWDTGTPDPQLVRVVTEWPLTAGRTLEIGCGTGTDAIWLTQQGFSVVACDVASTALAIARRKATKAGVQIELVEDSFPADCAPFDLAYDRGCFHTCRSDEARGSFAGSLAACLEPQGLWLSLMGSTDGPPRDHGPPRVSASEIASAIEPFFEVLSLTSDQWAGDMPSPARLWICLMRKRASHAPA